MLRLAERLASPSRLLTLAELRAAWFTVTISVRVPGCAVLAHDLHLLRRIRGGIGTVLVESASVEAAAGSPCPWDPPCALDVLFREQGRVGAHGIPKPYALSSDRRGADLVVRMMLFGFATDWAAVATHALVATMRHKIDWKDQRRDVFIPRVSVQDVVVRSREGAHDGLPESCADLEFLTPMNAERDDPIDRPGTVFARLARRVEGLARWHDAAIAEDWQALGEAWNSAAYDTRLLCPQGARRHAGRAHQYFDIPTVTGTLLVDGLTPPLWSLLVIGVHTHVGKGASEGFGRYQIA